MDTTTRRPCFLLRNKIMLNVTKLSYQNIRPGGTSLLRDISSFQGRRQVQDKG